MFDILRTRRGRLKDKIRHELEKENPSVDVILIYVDEYEKDNLQAITKLKKVKKVETNRIKGALKQTINAHSAITMTLIGSATKRIYGALLDEKKESFLKRLINKLWKRK
jgi:tRNA A37 threonylcarbamoyladenosine dehydratase